MQFNDKTDEKNNTKRQNAIEDTRNKLQKRK